MHSIEGASRWSTASDIRLSDGAGGEEEDVVSIAGDVGKERGDTGVRPVLAHERHDVAQDVRSRNRAINVRDNNARVVSPEIDRRLQLVEEVR